THAVTEMTCRSAFPDSCLHEPHDQRHRPHYAAYRESIATHGVTVEKAVSIVRYLPDAYVRFLTAMQSRKEYRLETCHQGLLNGPASWTTTRCRVAIDQFFLVPLTR